MPILLLGAKSNDLVDLFTFNVCQEFSWPTLTARWSLLQVSILLQNFGL